MHLIYKFMPKFASQYWFRLWLVAIRQPVPMLTQICVAIWRHWEVIGYMAPSYVTWRHRSILLRLWLVTWQHQAITWANVDKDPCLHMIFLESNELTCTFICHCTACRTSLIATRFWVVVICPIIKCLTVFEFSFILFDLCLFITIFYFILNYVLIVTFWIFTYHKIWILLIIFCFIWNYWIIYFLTCLEVFWSVVS